VLDHILISRGLFDAHVPGCHCTSPYDYDVVHVNSEFNDQASNHDSQLGTQDQPKVKQYASTPASENSTSKRWSPMAPGCRISW
jgi:hypothetical protein